MVEKTRDFRGNEYELYEELEKICSAKYCEKKAIRHNCIAEGELNRTHWHGAIHFVLDDSHGLDYFCLEHGVIEQNKWEERRKLNANH